MKKLLVLKNFSVLLIISKYTNNSRHNVKKKHFLQNATLLSIVSIKGDVVHLPFYNILMVYVKSLKLRFIYAEGFII